ncbi:MAG: ACT domain-containing protein, partial [Acidimicrobiia bacterium]
DAARNLSSGARGATMGSFSRKRVRPIDEMASQFYVLLEVADQPGVLATIAAAFGSHGVSIKSMRQQGMADDARLMFVTHRAREADLEATLHDVRALDVVHKVGSILRVVGEED